MNIYSYLGSKDKIHSLFKYAIFLSSEPKCLTFHPVNTNKQVFTAILWWPLNHWGNRSGDSPVSCSCVFLLLQTFPATCPTLGLWTIKSLVSLLKWHYSYLNACPCLYIWNLPSRAKWTVYNLRKEEELEAPMGLPPLELKLYCFCSIVTLASLILGQ